MTTSSAFVDAVRRELRDVPTRALTDALADLETLVAELRARGGDGAVADALGSPQAYAAELRAALVPPEDADAPQTRVLGVPVDVRGPLQARARSRVWDPTNPQLVVPRLAGAGWRLNYGAIAVRLGLLRPDDYDDDVLDRIPPRALLAARAVPMFLSAAAAAAVAARWSRLPERIPTSWDLGGRPQRWGDRRSLAAALALGLLPAVWAQGATTTEDTLVRSSLATSLAVVSSTVAAVTLVDADTRPGDAGHGNAVLPALLVAGVLGLLGIYLPVRAGLRASWRDVDRGSPPG